MLVGVAVLLCSCSKPEEIRAVPVPDVRLAMIEQRDVPVYREWVGTLEGDVNAAISAQVGGYLLSRDYSEGGKVTKGQVLFRIQPATFEVALANAKAQLTEALARKGKTASDVQRYRPLAKTQAISQQEFDDAVQADLAADAKVQAAQASVDSAQLNLGFATIRSPVDGIAGLAQAQLGDLVGPGSGQLTTVVKTDPMRVYFSVDQKLMTALQEKTLAAGQELRGAGGEYQGPTLELILASGSVYAFKGRVRHVNNQVDVKSGTVRVVGEFPNPQGLLSPGMFVRTRALMTTQKDALLVPQSALLDVQGRHMLALVDAENKVSIRPVELGEASGPLRVVTGSIRAGERVVAEGIQKARDGGTVHPLAAAEKGEPGPVGGLGGGKP